MEVLYRAHATASGGGRDEGRSATDDGKIDVRLSVPTEMGGTGGDGTNPEQLFATGSAACYLGALRLVAGKAGTPVGPDTKVTAGVGFGKNTRGEGFNLDVSLKITDHGLDQADRRPDSQGASGLPLLQRHARQRRGRPFGGIIRPAQR